MEPTVQAIAALNALLRGEISAVEIYRYTIDQVPRPRFRACLDDCMQSHARRVQLLRRRIQALGGIPTRGAGTWGMFVQSAGVTADLFGESGLFNLLELGEAQGHVAYLRRLAKLDPASRAFVEGQLIPAQLLTHEWIGELKRGGRVTFDSVDWIDR